ncbi:MAG: UPF0147 family protein [Candidatus Micrarchaeota archaeon]
MDNGKFFRLASVLELGKVNKKAMDELKGVADLMRNVGKDSTVPRNIRSTVLMASDKIGKGECDIEVEIGSAIYSMEDIANDINMPSHTRTELWNIISSLERIKETLNKK